jgi:hypothetical protein
MRDATYYGFVYLWENHHPNATKYKKYIGQHCGTVEDGYTGSGTIFKKYFYSKKYYGHWCRTILKYCNSKQELDEAEIEFINKANAVNDITYCNNKSGGTGKDGVLSSETRKKMSEKKRGKPPWNKGIPCTQETKLKMSNRLKGREAWNKGKKCQIKTKEGKQKISKALLSFHNKKNIMKEQQVLKYMEENKTVTAKQVKEIVNYSLRVTLKLIRSLISQNKIKKEGLSRNVVYTIV